MQARVCQNEDRSDAGSRLVFALHPAVEFGHSINSTMLLNTTPVAQPYSLLNYLTFPLGKALRRFLTLDVQLANLT
jgi:hypothetical protein